jgi:plastocyanin
MRVAVCLVVGAAASVLVGCGGGGGSSQSCNPGPTSSLTITDTGFVNGANNACVEPAGQVTFTNTGTSQHVINFDTPNCVPNNAVTVAANSSSPAVTFPNAQVFCNFHLDANAGLSGTIAVSNAVQTGGGY